MLDLKLSEKLMDIFGKCGGVIAGLRYVRLALPSAGKSQHAEAAGKFGGDVIKDVGRITQSWQEKQRFPGPAPVEIVQCNAVHRNESAPMRRRILKHMLPFQKCLMCH